MVDASDRKRFERGGGYGPWTATVVRTIVTSRRFFTDISSGWLIRFTEDVRNAPFCVFGVFAHKPGFFVNTIY